MELRKDTWHYRNWELWRDHSFWLSKYYRSYTDYVHVERGYELVKHPPKRRVSLCRYFWVVMLLSHFTRFKLFITRYEWLPPMLGYVAMWGVVTLITNLGGGGLRGLWIVPLVTLVAALFVAIMVGLGFLVSDVIIPKFNDWLDKPEVDKQPNLVVEYAKAKKQKVCPLIEFKEPD